MRNIVNITGIFMLMGILFLASCSEDDNPTPSNLKPAINFVVEQGYIHQDATLPVDSSFKVKILARENGTSGANLVAFEITRIFNLSSWDTTISYNQSEILATLEFPTQSLPGQERFEFEVTDKDNQKSMITLTITTESSGQVVVYFEPFILGSFNDLDYGSFFSLPLQQVMFKPTAYANQDKVDFAYYKGATTQNTIGAPASNNIKTVFELTSGSYAWSVFNDTKIAKAGITAAEFDAIGATYEFPNVTATTMEVNNLQANDVLVFKTVSGKVGFIKVAGFPAMRGDKIEVAIKVQE